ncbi:MAG: protein kinase [Polyangiaceae bacterium]
MDDDARRAAAPAEEDPLFGTVYRATRLLGAGAMGRVFEAEHTGLRRTVAVKLLAPALAQNPTLVDRARLEAQALAAIRHPNVVTVHDYAATPAGVPFLVMERLVGRSLDDFLQQRGALPMPEALTLVDQILNGLGAVHAAGLTHRDLKPSNVFLAEDGGRTIVKLLDLGIAKVQARADGPTVAPLKFPTAEGHAVGTPRCMAPEQILGRPCDARTDVYAAGVLVFVMLSGRDPFHHRAAQIEVLSAHLTETPPLLSHLAPQPIPPALDAVIARALAKEPSERFASAAEFGAALAQAVATKPTVTEKIAPTPSRANHGTAPIAPKRAPHGTAPIAPKRAPNGTVPIDPAMFRSAPPAVPFVRPVAAPVTARIPASPAPHHPPSSDSPRPSHDAAALRMTKEPPQAVAAFVPPPAFAPPSAIAGRSSWARDPRVWLVVATLLGGVLLWLGARFL